MISKNKDGQEIHPGIFKKMEEIGQKLEYAGFKESAKKPNLFYLPIRLDSFEFIGLADMRGTDIVPIWEMPVPLISVSGNDGAEHPAWIGRKANCLLNRTLTHYQIPFRRSFDETIYGVDSEDAMSNGANGYCVLCGNELFAEQLFCDSECEDTYLQMIEIINKSTKPRRERQCFMCGRNRSLLTYHIGYPEGKNGSQKKVTICKSCYPKINQVKKKHPEASANQ